MDELPLALYGCASIRNAEQQITKPLMQRAAAAGLLFLQKHYSKVKTIAVFCGPGNNGGDGYLLAALAKSKGFEVKVYQVGGASKTQDNADAKNQWLATGEEVFNYQAEPIKADLIVDALLGIGARMPLSNEFGVTVNRINESKIRVLSIDIPTGLNADTGECNQPIVMAKSTLTFIGLKLGLFCAQCPEAIGKLHFDSLGVSLTELGINPDALRIDYAHLIKQLPPRHLTAHKGEFGSVVVIGGGSAGFSGAPLLSAEAALRAGTGKVSVVAAHESLPLLSRSPSEIMCYGVDKFKEVKTLCEKSQVIILGPGLSQNNWGKHFFTEILDHFTTKLILIDADGLRWLAKYPQHRSNWVLTPHLGEASALLGESIEHISKNKIAAAKKIQEKFGGVVVLKGGSTIVYDGNQYYLFKGGLPILATAGTGDVLAGIIGGLLAQGFDLSYCAQLGVALHAQCAVLEQSMGDRGMLASDLFLHLRSLLNPG